jgi:hypothetical protein
LRRLNADHHRPGRCRARLRGRKRNHRYIEVMDPAVEIGSAR